MITNGWTELHDYNQRLVKAVKAILPLLKEVEEEVWWVGGNEYMPQIETIRELLREKEEEK